MSDERQLATWKFFIWPPDTNRQINVTLTLDDGVSEMLHDGYVPAWAAILEFLEDKILETEDDDE